MLARWNIQRALEALAWLKDGQRRTTPRAPKRLDAHRHGALRLAQVVDGYATGFDPETRLYEQFAGFYEMDDVPVEKLRPRPMAADLLLGRDVTLVAR